MKTMPDPNVTPTPAETSVAETAAADQAAAESTFEQVAKLIINRFVVRKALDTAKENREQ